MNPIKFTSNQHAELLKLGVVPQAIELLEIEALPVASNFLKRGPPKNAVLDELRTVEKSLVDARQAIERLLDSTDAVPHLREARARIGGGGYRHMFGGMRLDETSKSLAVAIAVVETAKATMPPGPVRYQSASPMPVNFIYSAVQAGAARAGQEPRSPKLLPSESPTSAFRRMVGICYEAIGVGSPDPERAIKAYVKQWRVLERHSTSLEDRTERTLKI